jgi:phage tail protein X
VRTYTTAEGDMLDGVCARAYGATAGVVELVLDANPGLAALGPIYEAGLEIALPDLAQPARVTPYVRLWS